MTAEYSIESTMGGLIETLEALDEESWEDVGRVLTLTHQRPVAERTTNQLRRALQRIIGDMGQGATFVWVLSYDDLDEGIGDHKISDDLRRRLTRLTRVHASMVDNLVNVVLRGERDWSELNVAVIKHDRAQPIYRVTLSLLNGSERAFATTAAGYARLLRSLAEEARIPWEEQDLTSESGREFIEVLSEARAALEEIEAWARDSASLE